MKPALAGTLLAVFGLALFAQEQVRLDPPVPTGPPTNSGPNPYRTISSWFKVPEGRTFGSTGGVAIDKRGHIWVRRFETRSYLRIRPIRKIAAQLRRRLDGDASRHLHRCG